MCRRTTTFTLCWAALAGGLTGLCACARPILPTLSVHALLVVHHADGEQRERGYDVSLLAQATFRGRSAPAAALHPQLRPATAGALPMLPNCDHSALCDWAALAEEAALAELGVWP